MLAFIVLCINASPLLLGTFTYPFLGLLRCPESSTSLLIHFRPWRNTINGHVQYLPRPNHVKEPINVIKDVSEHFLLRFRCHLVFWMEAWMNNAIHVQVQIVILYAIWIRFKRTYWHEMIVDDARLDFNNGANTAWIAL